MGIGIQSKTLILLSTAIILGGGLYFFEQQLPPPASEVTTADELFTFQESDVIGLRIQTRDGVIELQRDDSGKWKILKPVAGMAEEGAVVFLLNLLATSRSDRSLDVPSQTIYEFGLGQPTATVDITLADQTRHRLFIGNRTFDQEKVYAQVDPPETLLEEMEIVLVSTDLLNAVTRPVSEWQSQPTVSPDLESTLENDSPEPAATGSPPSSLDAQEQEELNTELDSPVD
ncbi:DUF4340 domain-containing protein [Candidatus Synechococcus calcipolaris G9]|uniref:DUF4340 domain-containing protein n=1 Tax=Candidatus Synechococcus calcipolaris G9 TaxID=1497997 RepID=A0ABT6EX48_9SYNE|nr:DUF4340 domain-containing protein [Candidatus Synechococcus calcipolaris]MDG2989480.1 DUF4340 domain-containing protein [Candidatus Synechococcus calcipolaris G9]